MTSHWSIPLAHAVDTTRRFEALLEREGLYLRYTVAFGSESSIFFPLPGDAKYWGAIHIRRSTHELYCDCQMTELVLLAHEYGHALSYRAGNTGPTYQRALDALNATRIATDARPLTPAEYQLIIEEEERAWSEARAVLSSLGLTDSTYFDSLRDSSLATYSLIPRTDDS